MTQMVPQLLIIVQLFLFLKYFGKFIAKWINPTSAAKPVWVQNRDRLLLIISIVFFFTSILLTRNSIAQNLLTDKANDIITLTNTALVFIMTSLMALFYHSNFKIFNPFVKNDNNIENKISTKFKIKKVSEEELDAILKPFLDEGNFTNDLQIFKSIFIDKATSEEKINCINTADRSKKIQYKKIFELVNTLSDEGIQNLEQQERRDMCNFICKNFSRNNQKIDYDNLNTAFSRWK